MPRSSALSLAIRSALRDVRAALELSGVAVSATYTMMDADGFVGLVFDVYRRPLTTHGEHEGAEVMRMAGLRSVRSVLSEGTTTRLVGRLDQGQVRSMLEIDQRNREEFGAEFADRWLGQVTREVRARADAESSHWLRFSMDWRPTC